MSRETSQDIDHGAAADSLRSKRRRDPERRRREIVHAAAELVIEIGVASLTHRLVAARAEVPLGSTTQYFATLDELRAAALARLADEVQDYVDQIAAALARTTDLAEAIGAIADGVHEYLSDPRLVRADAMLSAAAVVDAGVRPLHDRWVSGLTAVLAPRVGPTAAERLVIFIEGATWHTALNGAPPAPPTLTTGLKALSGLPSSDDSTGQSVDQETAR